MANSVYIGMSAAIAAQRRLEVSANNIANANTVGFRQQRVVFEEFLVDTLDGTPSQKGFTAVVDTPLDTEAGALTPTGNPLDLAIDGDGYFLTQGPQGLMATRAGNFQLGVDGQLLDASGLPVLAGSPAEGFAPIFTRPDGGPVSVGSDGLLEQGGTPLAKIAVVTSNAGMLPTGGAHLQVQPQGLQAVQNPSVVSGFLENSNVNPVRGMVELIEISHAYEKANKIMSEFRKLDQRAMSIGR